MADDKKFQEAEPFHRDTAQSAPVEKQRSEVREQQRDARDANYQAPQDLPPQEIVGGTLQSGKDKPFTVTVVGQEAILEIGGAKVRIDREQAQQLSKQMRRVAAATY